MQKLFKFVLKVHAWWIGQSVLPFILSANVIMIVLAITLSLLVFDVDEESINGPDLEAFGPWEVFVVLVVVAPLIETFLAQSVPIRLLQLWKPQDKFWLPWVGSTLVFRGYICSIVFGMRYWFYQVRPC